MYCKLKMATKKENSEAFLPAHKTFGFKPADPEERFVDLDPTFNTDVDQNFTLKSRSEFYLKN